MIYKAIKYILENDSDFATSIGTDGDSDIKAYPINPRKEVSLPFCVFNVIDQRGNPTKDGGSGMDECRVRIRVFDYELDDVIDLSDKVRAAMDGVRPSTTYNGVVIHSIDFESLNDDFDPAYGDRGVIIMEIDFIIWLIP